MNQKTARLTRQMVAAGQYARNYDHAKKVYKELNWLGKTQFRQQCIAFIEMTEEAEAVRGNTTPDAPAHLLT